MKRVWVHTGSTHFSVSCAWVVKVATFFRSVVLRAKTWPPVFPAKRQRRWYFHCCRWWWRLGGCALLGMRRGGDHIIWTSAVPLTPPTKSINPFQPHQHSVGATRLLYLSTTASADEGAHPHTHRCTYERPPRVYWKDVMSPWSHRRSFPWRSCRRLWDAGSAARVCVCVCVMGIREGGMLGRRSWCDVTSVMLPHPLLFFFLLLRPHPVPSLHLYLRPPCFILCGVKCVCARVCPDDDTTWVMWLWKWWCSWEQKEVACEGGSEWPRAERKRDECRPAVTNMEAETGRESIFKGFKAASAPEIIFIFN